MADKTILLGMPVLAGLHKLIERNLRHYGFNVVNIAEHDQNFRYASFADRLRVKWRQWVLHDTQARKNLKWQMLLPQIAAEIEAAGGLDYALFISGDIYSREFLQFVRSKSRNGIIDYQFDGLHRFPDIYPLLDEFDRVYVFDQNDLADPARDLLPATNFYFDDEPALPAGAGEGCYFLGIHHPSRTEVINTFARYARKNGIASDISIVWKNRKESGRSHYPETNINLMRHGIGFEANLEKSKRAAVLLDFTVSDHQGMSFRCFEAVGYRKKLITTNPSVRLYDFYHPDNIFVWDGRTPGGIDDFLNRPYHELPDAVRKKYSFGNWLNYLLDRQPHQKITLPAPTP